MIEEEMAKEYAEGMAMYYESVHGSVSSQFEKYLKKAYLAGLKARIKWHRVADGDLPPIEKWCCSIDVLIDRGSFAYYYYDDNCWFDSNAKDKIDPPKAWCEIPTYTEG